MHNQCSFKNRIQTTHNAIFKAFIAFFHFIQQKCTKYILHMYRYLSNNSSFTSSALKTDACYQSKDINNQNWIFFLFYKVLYATCISVLEIYNMRTIISTKPKVS